MIKKIIVVTLITVFGVSNASAQDDVSIMDLKETVYFLMKDVQRMKKQEEQFLEDTKRISTQNISKIEVMQNKIKELEKENEALRNKEIILEYKVSKELEKYKNNQK